MRDMDLKILAELSKILPDPDTRNVKKEETKTVRRTKK